MKKKVMSVFSSWHGLHCWLSACCIRAAVRRFWLVRLSGCHASLPGCLLRCALSGGSPEIGRAMRSGRHC